MNCFRCGWYTYNKLSEYGYYEYCPKCGNIFETTFQTQYNNKHFSSRYKKNKTSIIK